MSLLKEKTTLLLEETEFKTEAALNRLPRPIKWIIIISLAGLIPGYFAAKAGSYAYWQGNYKQYEAAARPSFSNPKDPKVEDISITALNDGRFAALATVANENLDLSLAETPYRILFYNAANELIYTHTDRLFLLPNQKKFLLVPKIESKERPTGAKVDFGQNLPWKKRLSLPKVALLAQLPRIHQQLQPMALAAEGTIYNNSPYRLGKARLTFLVYDGEGELVAASQRDEFSLKPYEKRAYNQLWPGFAASGNEIVQVYAETNLLDAQNLTLDREPTTTSSDLDRPDIRQ